MPPVSLDNQISDQPTTASTGDKVTATSNTAGPPMLSISNRSSFDHHPPIEEPSEIYFQVQDASK
jgi:hypothetical protein